MGLNCVLCASLRAKLTSVKEIQPLEVSCVSKIRCPNLMNMVILGDL